MENSGQFDCISFTKSYEIRKCIKPIAIKIQLNDML